MSSRYQPTRAELPVPPGGRPFTDHKAPDERHDMDRESSKHGPRLDEEMEEED